MSLVNPTHDADGNQLSGATGQVADKTFEWDGENRLIAVKDNAGTVLVRYAYDHASRRIRRTEAATTTLYVYDAWNCVAEYQYSDTPSLQRSYTWGLDLSGTLQDAGGVGGLLSVSQISYAQISNTAHPTYDGNGNVSEYLTATGSTLAHYEYDAFGNVIATTGNASAFEYRFSTKPQDAVTGWNYYGYRWYDAVSARWPSRDPIGVSGGANAYGFVANDAINMLDLFGLKDQECEKKCEGGKPKQRDFFGGDCCAEDMKFVPVGPRGTLQKKCGGGGDKDKDDDKGGSNGGSRCHLLN
ncbi:MAG: RHS repeat-associated core domain-containing protein [Verrucomicrobiaceae bacterium]